MLRSPVRTLTCMILRTSRCGHCAPGPRYRAVATGATAPQPATLRGQSVGTLLDLQNTQHVDAAALDLHPEPEEPLPNAPGNDLAAWPFDKRYLAGCEVQGKPLRVAVLLSGGVDSSLALALLRAAGHSVRAFYLQIWFQEDFRNFWGQCPWEEDLGFARQVCDQLDVPLDMVPLTDAYWQRVVSHCVQEIKAGRTPNPDVLCNSRVKFGAFYEHLEKHHPGQFDRIASGHYARVERKDGESDVQLMLTPDVVKDQTYFLAHLSQEQLRHVMFPLGPFTKSEVRALARSADLANQARKDSQGICFLGKVKFSEFVKEHLGVWKGPIIEEESNTVVGSHDGFWFYTIGQRSGLDLGTLPNGPWYVVRKNTTMNAVYVSLNYFSEDKLRNALVCGTLNWINGGPPASTSCDTAGASAPMQVKVRHGPNMYTCDDFQLSKDGSRVYAQLPANDQGLAAGQFAVFYQSGVCLGSGVIEKGLSVPAGQVFEQSVFDYELL